MYDKIKETAKGNNDIISLPDEDVNRLNPNGLLHNGAKNVISPQSLRDEIASIISKMSDRYNSVR